MKYIVDADATIDHLTQSLNLLASLPDLRPRDLTLSAATLIELYTGVDGSANPRQAERELKHFLRYVTVIPLNQRVIRATSRLRVRLLDQKADIKRRAYDLIVAATALDYDLILASSNTRDYQDILGLRHFNPRTGQLATY
jgi:tRNA(fMet)-specific endonuclease VapC